MLEHVILDTPANA